MVSGLEGGLMVAAFLAYACFIFSCRDAHEFTPRDIVAPGFLGSGRNIVETVGARFGRGFDVGAKSFPGALLFILASAILLIFSASCAIGSLDNIEELS